MEIDDESYFFICLSSFYILEPISVIIFKKKKSLVIPEKRRIYNVIQINNFIYNNFHNYTTRCTIRTQET
ncbi:hypothetical protein Tsubulata_010815, partial [Turnera subulata]